MLETVVPRASYSSVVKVVRGKRRGQVSAMVVSCSLGLPVLNLADLKYEVHVHTV